MSEQCCENCRFFDPNPEGSVLDGFGVCRRSPPRIIGELFAMDVKDEIESEENDTLWHSIQNSLVNSSVFPRTESSVWCGEWQAAEKDSQE